MTEHSASYRAIVEPKLGESEGECEDVYRVKLEGGSLHLAMSDGAAMSSFAKEWAVLLTSLYVQQPVNSSEELRTLVEAAAQEWRVDISSRPLAWYAQEKARTGAFATLLGVVLSEEQWRAAAIGDTCLFHVRSERLTSFPVERAADFSARPALLSSRIEANAELYNELASRSGDITTGDLLVLATDGLAEWLLSQHEAALDPWAVFKSGDSEQALRHLCQERRQSREMRNDDVACIWIQR